MSHLCFLLPTLFDLLESHQDSVSYHLSIMSLTFVGSSSDHYTSGNKSLSNSIISVIRSSLAIHSLSKRFFFGIPPIYRNKLSSLSLANHISSISYCFIVLRNYCQFISFCLLYIEYTFEFGVDLSILPLLSKSMTVHIV